MLQVDGACCDMCVCMSVCVHALLLLLTRTLDVITQYLTMTLGSTLSETFTTFTTTGHVCLERGNETRERERMQCEQRAHVIDAVRVCVMHRWQCLVFTLLSVCVE